MERATGTEVFGCGSTPSTDITLNIQTTTGGNFSISLSGKNTVEHLKKLVSKKLKVAKDRICLLHRERQLRRGTLEDNGLLDGARVILLPSVEAGLLSQRPDNSVMQALESLNENQVNDFLSGKSPLNLTMRLGDHMMLIQLQLSTLNSGSSGSRSLRTPATSKSTTHTPKKEGDSYGIDKSSTDDDSSDKTEEKTTDVKRLFGKREIEMIKEALFRSACAEEAMDTSAMSGSDNSDDSDHSPIKSLSNLVSSPINASTSKENDLVNAARNNLINLLTKKCQNRTPEKTNSATEKDSPEAEEDVSPESSHLDTSCSDSTKDDSSLNLTSSSGEKNTCDSDESVSHIEPETAPTPEISEPTPSTSGALPSFQSIETLKNKRFQYLMHRNSKFKQSVMLKHKKSTSGKDSEPYTTSPRKLFCNSPVDLASPSTSGSKQTIKITENPAAVAPLPRVDTKNLIEASKNLTQKLKKLSKEVLTNKLDKRARAEEGPRAPPGPGAVIESMKHHGKGIYSGTFSGTLNPALQDRYGRPKRDISTIIHILNDLLCASPAIAQKDTKHSCSPAAACACGAARPAARVCACAPGAACARCDSARTLASDNSKTKCKLEQLRLVMQQKKERREARKLKPYASPPKAAPPDATHEEIESLA